MKFVCGQPAAVVGSALVIADLHLGIEYELQEKGVLVELQYKEAAKQINALLKQTRTKSLLILGDAKHDVFGLDDKELRMMNAFFSLLKTKDVTITKGNHDSRIEEITRIQVVKEKIVKEGGKKILFTHGHLRPETRDYDLLAIGHCHPIVEIREGDKFVWRDKAWVVGKNFVVFPAFGPLIGGKQFTGNPISPLISGEEALEARAVLLNGLKLGKIKELV